MTDEDHSSDLQIGEHAFKPGEKGVVDLHIGSLIDHQPVTMSVHVRRGKEPGPVLLLTAGIHGDEIIGVEVLRRLLKSRRIRKLKGTIIVVPVVCMPAFLGRTRYLPDRRDLNRLFPGSSEGSLGSRLASTFLNEVVDKCTHSIDFHAGAVGRPNLPQIRTSPGDEVGLEMAKAFRPPVVAENPLREGSLRYEFRKRDIPTLLYEAGEAFRLDQSAVRYALRGVLDVMEYLEMVPPTKKRREPKTRTVVAKGTGWVRAPRGGIFTALKDLGNAITAGTKLGHVADPFGRQEIAVTSAVDGIIIGLTREATADEGDALFHIATTRDPERAEAHIQRNDEILEEHTEELQ